MNRKNLLTGVVLLIVAASLGLNIYLIVKNNELTDKINSFIPQAMSLEEENRRLVESGRLQLQQLDDCAALRDSLQTIAPIRSLPPAMEPSTEPLPQQAPQSPVNNNGTLRDLNKGIQ